MIPTAEAGAPFMQSWAEAIGALGTTAGFLIAALVYWANRRDRIDDESNDARLVYRTRGTRIERETLRGDPNPRWTRRVTFEIMNESDGPVHDLQLDQVYFDGHGTPPSPDDLHNLPELLMTGQQTAICTLTFPGLTRDVNDAFNQGLYEIEFSFLDAVGRRWARKGKEQPRRIRPKAGPRRR